MQLYREKIRTLSIRQAKELLIAIDKGINVLNKSISVGQKQAIPDSVVAGSKFLLLLSSMVVGPGIAVSFYNYSLALSFFSGIGSYFCVKKFNEQGDDLIRRIKSLSVPKKGAGKFSNCKLFLLLLTKQKVQN